VNFSDVQALAKAARVTMHAACERARVAYSTPYRWGKGSAATPELVDRIRAAVIVIASERRTLPAEYEGQVEAARDLLGEANTDPHKLIDTIEQDLKRLRRSLPANGVQAAAS
jgi:hypothetical protein